MAIDSLSYNGPKFSAEGGFADGALTLKLSGDCNNNAIAPLEEVLNSLHAEAQRLKARDVAIDLEKLEFMNSACLKKVLTWLSRVQVMDAAAQYRIRFLSNPKMVWQRKCLHALRCFAVDLITLET